MTVFHINHPHFGFLSNAVVGLSAIGAFTAAADGSLDSTEVTWLLRLIFGGMLLLNGYFIKQTARKFETQIERTRSNTESIRTLTQIARVVLTAMVAGTAGDPEVGRRRGDPLLATLLREIEVIEENNSEYRDNQ